jgi:hypothetical protein
MLSPGVEVDAVEVPIAESNERWSTITLEDGSVIRAKMAVMSVARIVGQWDQEGKPNYIIKSTPMTVVVSAPDSLCKKDA